MLCSLYPVYLGCTLGLFSKDPPIYPNTHTVDQNQNEVKFRSVRTLLRITHLAHRKSYLVIICPNSHEKLTKSETRRLCVLANTKLYHRNLLLWISMKFWILVSTTLGLFSKDPPIYPNTHTKFTKIKIRSSLGQFKHCSASLIYHIGSHIWSFTWKVDQKWN